MHASKKVCLTKIHYDFYVETQPRLIYLFESTIDKKSCMWYYFQYSNGFTSRNKTTFFSVLQTYLTQVVSNFFDKLYLIFLLNMIIKCVITNDCFNKLILGLSVKQHRHVLDTSQPSSSDKKQL